jgi:U3 small nucleolar RNA-associated protein MPP10
MDGVNDDQIWEQLDLKAKKLCETLEEVLEGTTKGLEDTDDGAKEEKDLRKILMNGGTGLEELDWGAEGGLDDEDSEHDEDEDEERGGNDEDMGEDVTQELRDSSSEEDSEDGDVLLNLPKEGTKISKRKSGRRSELDDDFFNMESFNAEADEGEAMSVSKGRLGEEDSDSDMSVDLFAPVDDAEIFEEEDLEDASAGMNAYVYI